MESCKDVKGTSIGYVEESSKTLFIGYPGMGGDYLSDYFGKSAGKSDVKDFAEEIDASVFFASTAHHIEDKTSVATRAYDELTSRGIEVEKIVFAGYSASGDDVFYQAEKFLEETGYTGSIKVVSTQPSGLNSNVVKCNDDFPLVKDMAEIYIVGNAEGSQCHKSKAKNMGKQGYDISYLIGDSAHSCAARDLIYNGIFGCIINGNSSYKNKSASSQPALASKPNFRTGYWSDNFLGGIFKDRDFALLENETIESTIKIPSNKILNISDDEIVTDNKSFVTKSINLIINNFNNINYSNFPLINDPIGISELIANCVSKYNDCGITLKSAIEKVRDNAIAISNAHENEDKELADSAKDLSS